MNLWPFKWYLCALKKPSQPEKGDQWVKVWGFNWGLFPGWHTAYYDENKQGWYHHQYSKVSPALIWKYVPNPNKKYKDSDERLVETH
jgi:hypothetical protein